MKKQNESVFLLFVLLSVWLSACAPASTPMVWLSACAPASTPIPPTITPRGPFPTGSYKAVNPVDVTDLVLLEDGTFTRLLASENSLITGTYEVTGDKIVLNEDPGMPCTGYPGTYTWSFDGKTLTLKVVEDNCDFPRSHNLSRSWSKQP